MTPCNEQPLILTLQLDQVSFERFNHLRQRYFPPARNLLPAHVTLFHKLPAAEAPAVQQQLQHQCSLTQALPLSFAQVRSLGKGVAIDIAAPALIQLHQHLAQYWNAWLTRQDQQRYRPHITLQNKVTLEQARQLYEQLTQEWQPWEGRGEGLLLWRYLGGPWELVRQFSFGEV